MGPAADGAGVLSALPVRPRGAAPDGDHGDRLAVGRKRRLPVGACRQSGDSRRVAHRRRGQALSGAGAGQLRPDDRTDAGTWGACQPDDRRHASRGLRHRTALVPEPAGILRDGQSVSAGSHRRSAAGRPVPARPLPERQGERAIPDHLPVPGSQGLRGAQHRPGRSGGARAVLRARQQPRVPGHSGISAARPQSQVLHLGRGAGDRLPAGASRGGRHPHRGDRHLRRRRADPAARCLRPPCHRGRGHGLRGADGVPAVEQLRPGRHLRRRHQGARMHHRGPGRVHSSARIRDPERRARSGIPGWQRVSRLPRREAGMGGVRSRAPARVRGPRRRS